MKNLDEIPPLPDFCQQLLLTMPDSVIVTDQAGTVVLINLRTIELFGLDQESDMTGTPLTRWVESEDAGRLGQAIAEISRNTFTGNNEFRFIRKNGTSFFVAMNGSVLSVQAGNYSGLILTLRDISVKMERLRRTREEILQEREKGERLLTEMGRIARVGGWEFDVATGEGTWTEEVAIIHEMDPASPTNREIGLSVFEGDYRVAIEQAIREAIEKQKPYDLELKMTTRKGNYKWVKTKGIPVIEGGRVVRLRGSLQDITDRKLAEIRAIEVESAYRSLFKHSMDAILLTAPDGSILEVNEATCRMFGRSAQEIVSIGRSGLVDPDDPGLNQALWERKGNGKVHTELSMVRADGQRFPAEVTSSVFSLADGQERTSMIIRDISERRKSELALRKSRAELDFALSMSRIGRWELDLNTTTAIRSREHARIFGYQDHLSEWNQARFLDHVLEDDRASVMKMISEMVTNRMDMDCECRIRRADGEVRWIWIAGHFHMDELTNNPKLVGVVQDITHRKKVEEEIRRKNENLDRLIRISRKLASTLQLDQILQIIIESAIWFIGCDTGAIYLIDRNELTLGATYPPLPSDTPKRILKTRLKYHPHIQTVLETRQPLVVPDTARVSLTPQESEIVKARKLASLLYLPLMIDDRRIGVMILGSTHRKEPIRESDFDNLRIFASQAVLAIANARLFEELQESSGSLQREVQKRMEQEQLLKRTMNRLVATEELLKREAAQQLHDQVGQNLTALNLNLRYLMTNPGHPPSHEWQSRLDDSSVLLDETVEQIRNIMTDLYPSVLDDYGLFAALSWSTAKLARRTGLDIALTGDDLTRRAPREVEYTLYRIAQEALHNVVRHARPTRITIRLEESGSQIRMAIGDNGVGFVYTPSLSAEETAGFGLASMQTRIRALGGSFDIETAPGKGTLIKLTIKKHNI